MAAGCKKLMTSVWARISYRKPLIQSLDTPLDRCLTMPHLLFAGFSQVIGAGIFVLSGVLISEISGPSTALSYLLSGIGVGFTAFCYAEFSALIPKAGSCFAYTYHVIGELPALLIGWAILSDIMVGQASVSKAFSGTLNRIVGNAITNYSIEHIADFREYSETSVLDSTVDLVAIGAILLMALITATGANLSMTLNIVITSIVVSCLILIGIFCYVYGDIENWNDGFFPYGASGFFQSASLSVFAYSGFELIANVAEEAKNPRRDLPRAILICLPIIIVLYFFVSLGLSYLQEYKLVNTAAPFLVAFDARNAVWAKWISVVGALVATFTSALANSIVSVRVLYSMASEALLPGLFGRVNRTTKVPLFSLMMVTIVVLFLSSIFKLIVLAEILTMATVIAYFVTCFNLLVHRYQLDKSDQYPLRSFIPEFCIFRGFLFPNQRIFLCLYAMFSLCFGAILKYSLPTGAWYNGILLTSFSMAIVFIFIILCLYEPTYSEDIFQTPLMPVVPCLGVLLNGTLMMQLQPMTWARFALWSLIGVFLYAISNPLNKTRFCWVDGFENSGQSYEELPLEGDSCSDNDLNYGTTDSQRKTVTH